MGNYSRLQARMKGHCARCLGEIQIGNWITEAEKPRPFHGYRLTWVHCACPCDLQKKPVPVSEITGTNQVLRVVNGKAVVVKTDEVKW